MYNPEKCIDFSFGIKKNEIACSCQKPFVKSSSFLEWGLPETSFNCIEDPFFEKQNNQSASSADRVKAFPFSIFNLINQGQPPKQAEKPGMFWPAGVTRRVEATFCWNLCGGSRETLHDCVLFSCSCNSSADAGLCGCRLTVGHSDQSAVLKCLLAQLENEGRTVQPAQSSWISFYYP